MHLCQSFDRFLGKARALAAGGALAALAAAALLFGGATTASAQALTSHETQLSQLFLFETTNNKFNAGEGYLSAQFAYLDFKHGAYEYRYQAQGQYSFTNQLAVGGLIPIIHSKAANTNTGFGDILVYAQYRLDQIIPRDIIELTAQVDVVLPTGSTGEFRDTGRFGVRPWLQAYKDFGTVGPGRLAAYGEIGFTITDDSDFRFGLAGTYEWQRIVGIVEFYDQAGGKLNRPFVTITPGVAFRPGQFEIAIGIPLGLNDASPDWGVIVKGTWNF
ncbi:MAG TPA: hypothetical protein VLJ39_10495 [Tepidisphaeraceae bacterium]|nr:hypothetical protein [Tepidisphaeraceae bacterium]